MGGKHDYQYVSSIDNKAQPTGYDKLEYALKLTEWQSVRVLSFLNSIGAEYEAIQVDYNGYIV